MCHDDRDDAAKNPDKDAIQKPFQQFFSANNPTISFLKFSQG